MATRNENIRYTTYLNDKEVGKSMNSMYNHARKLKNEIRRLEVGSKEWVAKMSELDKVNKKLKPLQQRMRGLQSPMQKLKDMARGLLPAFSFAAIGTGLVRLGKELLGTATKLEQIDKRARIVFGDSFPRVSAEAEKLAGKMGLTNNEFINAATNTGDLLIPLDFTREKAADLSVKLQSLSGALNEWSGGQLGAAEVSNILTKAMLGENEQLKQLGIAIRKDSEEFRDLVEVKMQDSNVTKAQAEALATLELIQKKSADAQAAYLDNGNNLLRLQQSLSLGWKRIKERMAEMISLNPEQQKQSDLIMNTRKELLHEIDVLIKGNYTADERAKIIGRINTQYAAYLPNLINEKSGIDDLIKVYDELSTSMMEMAIARKMAEDIEEFNEGILQAGENVIQGKKQIVEFNEEMAKSDFSMDNIPDLKLPETALQALEENVNSVEKIKDHYKELAKQMNMSWESIMNIFNKNPEPPPTTVTPTGDNEEKPENNFPMGPFPMDPETQAFIDEQMAEHMAKLQEFQFQVEQMGMNGREKDLSDTQMYYDQLINQADWYRENDFLSEEEHLELKKQLFLMYQEDISNIEEYYRDQKESLDEQALKDEQKKRWQAAAATMNIMGNLAGSIASLYSEQSDEFKHLMAFQTTINAIASAVSAYNAVVGIMPVGPVLAPIAAAAALAFGFAQVKKIYSEKTPEFSSGYELGGPTLPYPHGAMISEAGEEYMIPNWLRGDPQVAAFENIIEAKRASGPQAITNNYSQAAAAPATDPALLAALERNTEVMQKLESNGVQGVWEWDRYKDGRNEMEAIEEEAKIQ